VTWSISLIANSKAEAKLAVTRELPKAMLHQQPHARDYDVVRGAINGAIDACAEGAVSVVGSGHLNGEWQGGDIPEVRGVVVRIEVSTTKAP
jgi:hypothetical protein